MSVTLHLLDARGDLSALAPWLRRTVSDTHRRVTAVLELGPIDMVVQAGQRVIPEKGHVGHAIAPGIIYVTVDPASAALRADADASLARMIAHELHHAARWDGPGYGHTLGAALVSEGLACCFAQEVFGPPLEPWEQVPLAVIAEHLSDAEAAWDDDTYDHGAWFFGAGDRPRSLGYSLGYHLVRAHLLRHPGHTAVTLAHAPSEPFRSALADLRPMPKG
ncbi:hypothetical protein JANAI62_10120 [Jannaschia pagri]|uniref:DUF2268 domain-containing protein n=1 Tax=Jannaschia pagri TaxID=2829797 RepID=A0ABQ4NIZ3_9RHOB|nr:MULTISPECIES: DUF2268 domain-containing putative Zn-dependent protease [unclassified Jannaschia]GIT90557.1 hypothetical protein JANAI61_10150 [Jannaschia sp. AI_61]GIT94389.1 hypothetical protein JANAI62_10120 [Jannaschia sp. AI_62]